jgi:hypothetical protein
MNAALVAAIIGAAAALLAAFWTSVDQLLRERRRERNEARVAALSVRHELKQNIERLEAAADLRRWWLPGDMPAFSSWEQHGPALLVARRLKRPSRIFGAISAAQGLAVLAQTARRMHDAAPELRDQRLAEIERGEGVEPNETPEQARKKAEDTFREHIRALEISDQGLLDSIAGVKNQLNDALREDVPEHEPSPWPRRVAALLVAIALVVGAVVGLQATRPDVSTDELAAALRTQRGVDAATCDPVKDVDNTWNCQLAYIADGPVCQTAQRTLPGDDERLAVAVAQPAAGRLAGAQQPPDCKNEGTPTATQEAQAQLEGDLRLAIVRVKRTQITPASEDAADRQARDTLLNKLKALPRQFWVKVKGG